MSEPKVEDHTEKFIRSADTIYDIALGMMAQDIEMIAAFKVPVDTGALARYIKRFRVTRKHWKVTVNKDYAAYQERGSRQDGSRAVHHYSRAGSGAHFLRDAGLIVQARAAGYFKKANASGFTKVTSGTDFG